MEKIKRPILLESLCILSFIGNAGGFLICLTAGLFFKKTTEFVISITNLTAMDRTSPLYFCIIAVLHLISFFGVFRIWNLKRDGLMIYIPVQLCLLFFPGIWLGWQAFSMTGTVFTALFIVLYLTQVRRLKGFHDL